MSYCQIITFKDGLPHRDIEYSNAWGGAARIWSSLFDAYLKNPAIPYHSWLSDQGNALWPLAKRSDLPMFERAVHASTFDVGYVRREHFLQFAADVRAFVAKYPVPGKVDHLPAWADAIEASDAEAVGFRGTSVAETPWFRYDEEKDEEIPKPMSEGFEVYDWLASLGGGGAERQGDALPSAEKETNDESSDAREGGK